MERRKRRPIPTSLIIGIGLLIIGGVLLFGFENVASGLLCLLLAAFIGFVDVILLPCSTILLRGSVNKKELSRYRNFALFYLKDRRIAYTKKSFENAIAYQWLDIVTMCLLLGMRKAYEQKEQENILLDTVCNDKRKLYEILLRGGFNGHFIVSKTGQHFLFETLKAENPIYLELLLQKKINPNIMNSEGDTPLFIAIREEKMKHIEVLLNYGSSLEVQNKKGLTPLFYAVKEGKLEICEMFINKMDKQKEDGKIKFKRLKEPLMVNPKPAGDTHYLLLKLIASKDKSTLEMLKKYFEDKSKFHVTIETEVELYTRLSSIEASIVKKENTGASYENTYTEEACKKDLFAYILKGYQFGRISDLSIDSIYKEPKCIDSHKEKCHTCSGTGHVLCTQCGGIGTEECPTCNGKGEMECSKCHGTLKISCQKVQKYIECKTCKEGVFECVKCDSKGQQPCPQCNGHGTVKCQCPPSKKKKCPHCDNGYIAVKGGMYRKCGHCKDGEICMLCNDSGWVDRKYKDKGYECKTCKGIGKIPCQTCRGKKNVRCSKRFEIDCGCETGLEQCARCNGTTVIACTTCNGTKREKCLQCSDGFLYTNVYIDFKATQALQSERIVSKIADKTFLKELLPVMTDKICENHPYIEEVYTVFQIGLKPSDVVIRSNGLQMELGKIISERSTTGILDILELAPLYYTRMVFKEKEGKVHESILVNDVFYKTIIK